MDDDKKVLGFVSKQISKPKVNKKEVYLSIIRYVNENYVLVDIARKLGVSKQSLNRHIQVLKANRVLYKQGEGRWTVWKIHPSFDINNASELFTVLLSKQKDSFGTRKSATNLHALQINFPVVSGVIPKKGWSTGERLNGWVAKYIKIPVFKGLRMKNNNNKSITVWVESRNILKLEEVHQLSYSVKKFVYLYFKKQGVIIDDVNCVVKNLDLSTEDDVVKETKAKGEKVKVKFTDRKCEKIFPKDDRTPEAWMDDSPTKCFETNDLALKRAYLKMPFNVEDIKNKLKFISTGDLEEVRSILLEQSKLIQSQMEVIKKQAEINSETAIGLNSVVKLIDNKKQELPEKIEGTIYYTG